MPSTDREELKEQLRAMVAGRGDGIDLDTPFQWVIEGLKRPVVFFEHLPTLLPSDSILYVEGTSIAPEVAALFDHIKAYRGESLLFTFHDAFDGWLCISEHVPGSTVAEFCRAPGVSH